MVGNGRRFRSTLGLVLAGATSIALADPTRWNVERAAEDGSGAQRPIAVVASAEGDALRVHRAASGAVALSLRLRDGFERLDAAGCPTLRIDDTPATGRASRSCEVADRVVTVELGRIDDGGVRSAVLAGLIQGTRLTWRVRLRELGYREIAFTLKGSKQAVMQVIGPDTRVRR